MPHRSRPSCAATTFLLGSALLAIATSCTRPAADPKTAASAAPAPAATAQPAAPPATATFKFASQSLTVPAGYTIELVAGPPLVNRPISLAFDEQGRLYATDSSGFSERSDKQIIETPHRIVRLSDTDGDGRFDHSTVFAERMMFPQGALFYRGSLYVAAPPHLWKLTDTDGDGTADKREVWYDGKTLTGCANDLHGPYLGPDGWFYFTKGAFAEQRHTLGTGKNFVTRAAHIFRSRPDGTGFEPVLTGGMDNPVGVAFSATGERFLSGTFFQLPAAGKRDGLIHAIYGGVYGKENAASSGHARTGDLMPIMTHMGSAAPCGSTLLESSGLGYAGDLLACYFNLRKISRHELVADGATFATRDHDLVTSDSLDFRPTDVLEDADGSLLIADTGAWYKMCCPTSALSKPDILGGIYRLRRNTTPRPDDPRGQKIPWTALTPEALAQLLADPRPYVRHRALDRISLVGDAAVPALTSSLTAKSANLRRDTLWALARIESDAARAASRSALTDHDTSVTHVAAQVASLHRDRAAVPQLLALLNHANLQLVRLAAEALGRIGDARALDPLLAAITRLGDSPVTATGTPAAPAARVLEHALIYALIDLARPAEHRARLASASSPRVTRALLVALDQMEGATLAAADIAPLLDSPTASLRHTSSWIAAHRPEWGDALADTFRDRLTKGSPLAGDSAATAELHAQLIPLTKSAAIQSLLATTAADPKASLDSRRLVLSVMAASGLREAPVAWLDALATALTTPELARDIVAVARAVPPPKSGHAALLAAVAKLARDPATSAELRLEALTLAPESLAPPDAGLFAFLQAQLAPDRPLGTRSTAAQIVSRARLAPPQQVALADTLRTTGSIELPKLLPAFERAPTEALGLRLVAALAASPGLAGLRASALQTLLAKYPATVQQSAAPLLTRLNPNLTDHAQRLEELLATTKDGNAARGHAVFNSEKAACIACHKIGYGGGLLGPDLTNIARIRNARELLEAVVFPSATFVRGYEPFEVTTKSGVQHHGLLRAETADELLLATGPETEQRVSRADVAKLEPGTVSPMPPGSDTTLTRPELADLLAFLLSRK